MEENFALVINQAEKDYLHALVRRIIADSFKPGTTPENLTDSNNLPPPESELLKQKLGAFVTLKRQGNLRGCIGWLVGTEPLYLTVARMALSAAFKDPRFAPLQEQELKDLEIEISIMGPITLCPDPELIQIGRHGLIMRRGNRQGLLLPQVPQEWGWDRQTFLAQTCVKAGLPPQSWQEKETEILWFEAIVF